MARKFRKRTRKKSLPIERRRKIVASLAMFIGLLLIISLLSHRIIDDRMILDGKIELLSLSDSSQLVDNRGGVVGAYLSMALYFLFGWGAYLAPLGLLCSGLWLWNQKFWSQYTRPVALYSALFGVALLLFDNLGDFSTLPQTLERSAIDILASYGGVVSLKINFFALKFLGGTGSTLTIGTLAVIVLLLALPKSVKLETIPEPVKKTGRAASKSAGGFFGRLFGSFAEWRQRRADISLDSAVSFVTGEEDDNESVSDGEFENRLRKALSDNRGTSSADSFESRYEPNEESSADSIAKEALTPRVTQASSTDANSGSDDTAEASEGGEQTNLPLKDYKLPELELLSTPPRRAASESQSEMAATANELRETLATFGVRINGEVRMLPGPVVTRFEFRPALGVKVNQILNLSDDLALALRAKHIRIVAPIPGKAAVGIEVPNRRREIVFLKDVIKSRSYTSADIRLPVALGKSVSGEPHVADLAKMPHLLIAGSTGSGKSVCINAIITSLLYRMSPEDLRFIFIDPKMLELSVYSGIPHLEQPVVTNPRKAERVLADAVTEMENRYKKLAIHGVRNIVDYNRKMEETTKRLPYLVIIIDELADLMMTQTSAKTELLITRLAQMARAVGIHLILATQRPSVDVITGLIKANFPSRIAFHVPSKTDSRTILDANGAEKLLGQGDMLFQWAGQPDLIRLHGALITSEETDKVVARIRSQKIEVPRIEAVSKEITDEDLNKSTKAEKVDPVYLEAIEIVMHHKQASVSLLQRRLGVGYQRAARLIDRMEESRIIGPYDGSKARQVLVDQSYLDEIRGSMGQDAESMVS